MDLQPHHIAGIGTAGALLARALEQGARVLIAFINRKKTKALPPKKNNAETIAEIVEKLAELKGEMHEFKRAVLEEIKVQRGRYHGLRSLVVQHYAVEQERKRARAAGEDFDTNVYDLRELWEKLEQESKEEDTPLPALSPPLPQEPIE